MPPLPPHSLPIKLKNKFIFLFFSFLVSTMLTLVFGAILNYYRIPIIVIIPSSAPIWIGLATISYMVQTERD